MAKQSAVTVRMPGLFIAAAALLALMPFILNPYYIILMGYAMVFSIACLGLNLLLGNTGLVSFGHAAYFGIGAYTGGFLYTFSDLNSLEAYIVSGLISAGILSVILGFICVRSTRIHFTILTLAFGQMIHSIFISGIIFRPFGGVGKGLFLLGGGGMYIPRLLIAGTEFGAAVFNTVLYYIILAAFAISLLVMWRIVYSPFGKALRAIRDNDLRAEFVGIRVRRYRWYAFIISALFTALAGALFGQLSRQVTPEQLNWLFSAQLVLATVLGGTRSFIGPLAGAFSFVAIEDISSRLTHYQSMVFGFMLVAVVFVFPSGVAGTTAALIRRLKALFGNRL